jgi:sugar phosphate permease
MDGMLLLVAIAYSVICALGMYRGRSLRSWSSWLYGLAGFVCGLAAGFLSGDLQRGVQAGMLLAFIVMFSAQMIYWQRQRFK